MSLTRLVNGFGLGGRPAEAASRALAEQLDPDLAVRLVNSFEAQGSGWFWESDRAGRIVYLSGKVAKLLDEVEQPAVGRLLTELFEVNGELEGSERTLNFHLNARTSFAGFEVRSRGNGAERIWTISGRPHIDEMGQFRGFVGHGADLTAERRSDAEIKRLALSDSLTGLANRARMRTSLDQIIMQLERNHRPAALFMLDLDRFKAVNDTLGHQTGDALLKVVAQRLETCVADKGLVGRLGGDEFQVIVSNYGNRSDLEDLAQRIISSLSQPYFISGSNISIGCSVGIAVAPEDGSDSEILIRNADLSLYDAKAEGRGRHRFFRTELLRQAQTRKILEDDLRQALDRGELWIAYQPVVSTLTKAVVGYEALLRWNHPRLGAVSPAEFIPIAEDSSLIDPIGEWVLRTACATAARWPRPVRIAINVSPVQFARQALPAIVASALANSGLASDRLELEITESIFLNEDASTERMLGSLKQMGLRLVLDDFGTGYSSLAYLKKAPFDKIKIDQSFVRGAALDPRNAAIIRAVVAIADTLKLETTAEGVETQDEIELIARLGCSHIQGFVYGRPVSGDDVAASLANSAEATPVGLKTSRLSRQKLLRSTRLEVHGRSHSARIRDISTKGLMIDGYDLPLSAGQQLQVDIADNKLVPAVVRWAKDGRAGLEFVDPVDLSAPASRARRM
ncbi:EAL domain-containing protein [Allosphingosinicella deserti]|uniref:Diguanylate cyclase n=1 Tax=Allosphingosinicella deserti TaxID=2116704 RepID=A0A2P7QYP4_9SPHN|nr:EAL domain-containing protein [Sphingomonas deserti]PSJ43080.1 diguanylate cyclase [Sphingomonas deserti]